MLKDARCRLSAVLGSIAIAAALGCERHDDAVTPAFMPTWEQARSALEKVLCTWRDAPSPPPPNAFSTGDVQFVDKRRKPNQRLVSFQVLGQTAIENARQFTVRLNLEGEETPELVKYNIVGRNPVWVFRLEDYETFSHWEHDMTDPVSERSTKSEYD
jgi:hypothetical protein